MAWPPTIPPATRTDATSQTTNHPQDHNQTSQALTDIVTRVDQNSLLAWSGIDNPASTIITAHNAISLAFTLPSTQYCLFSAQIPVTWAGAPAASDIISASIQLDGAWTGVGTITQCPITSGTGFIALQMGHIANVAAGAHTVNFQVARLAGAQYVVVGSVGYGFVMRIGTAGPV